MSDQSVFMDKASVPTYASLEKALGSSYDYWEKIVALTYAAYPEGKAEWNFPGKNYGWSFRIKDKRRAILYLLPRSGYFKAAFVFGDKAVASVMNSDVPEDIKKDLQAARKYAEGRGVSIEVHSNEHIPAIKKLIDIKLAH